MSSPLYPHVYAQLIEDEIEWLYMNSPDCMQRRHIIDVMRESVKEYEERGYEEAMTHTGRRAR